MSRHFQNARGRTPRHAVWSYVTSMIMMLFCALVANAGSSAQFLEQATQRGLNYHVAINLPWTFGYGVAMVDLNNDGYADVITLGQSNNHVGVFENDGTGHFINRTLESGMPTLADTSGIVAGDYDGDGDLDLYITRWLQADRLMRNDGDFLFTDVTVAAGLDGNNGAGTGCAWGDYNGDGWLDLYVSNRTLTNGDFTPNKLYRHNGDPDAPGFTDVAPQFGVDDDWPTFQAIFFDSDRDGDVDLYLSTDKGYANPQFSNRLFENVNGELIEISNASGADISIDSMGVGIGDFDGNLLYDIYCTNTPSGNVLLLNAGDHAFSDATIEAGVGSFAVGWGAQFFDFDNDGDLDLYACNSNDPNRLYRQDERWPTVDVAEQMGVAGNDQSYGMALADIDHDGDLDLLVQDLGANVKLYINETAGKHHWLRLNIVGQWPNLHAVGADIEVHTASTVQLRQVRAGGNYKSQNEFTQHVGLGDAMQVDELIVTWPGGAPQRTLANLPADNTWTIYPPDQLGDSDSDGDVDLLDFVAFAQCAQAEAFEPGCEMMDIEGDSDVDGDDLNAFIDMYDWFLIDCNANGVADMIEIINGSAVDTDGDGLIDSCHLNAADFDGNGSVDVTDLLALLGEWNQPTSPADLTGDGIVDVADLLALLADWGS